MTRITQKDAIDAYQKSKQPMCTELLDKIDRAIIMAANSTQTCTLVYAPFIASSTVAEILIDLTKRGFKAEFLPNPAPHFTIIF